MFAYTHSVSVYVTRILDKDRRQRQSSLCEIWLQFGYCTAKQCLPSVRRHRFAFSNTSQTQTPRQGFIVAGVSIVRLFDPA